MGHRSESVKPLLYRYREYGWQDPNEAPPKLSSELENHDSLNRIVYKVWQLLEQTLTINEIAAVLATEFGLSRDRALTYTRELIDFFNWSDSVTVGNGYPK